MTMDQPPPVGYTGAQTTGAMTTEVGIDWISYTRKGPPIPDDVFRLVDIPPQDWTPCSGKLNYREGVMRDGYNVFWQGTSDNMGVHLRMSGEACRDLAARRGLDWCDWLRERSVNGSFSRIDVAFDIRGSQFPLDRFFEDVRQRRLVSRWKEARIEESLDLAGEPGSRSGSIARFGSRSSRTFLRVYDKGAQLGEEAGQWVRVELETKGDRTAPLVDNVLQRGLQSVAGIINGLLSIKCGQAPRDERYRLPPADYWRDFLAGAAVSRLTVPTPRRTASTVAAWVDRQVGPALAMLLRHHNYGPEYIQALATEASSRMSKRHNDMLLEGLT